jgi:hypothetical protein
MTEPTPTGASRPRKADAFVVSCIDPRLTDDTTFLLTALGRTDRYSEMRIAGAALAAVDPARPAWNAALWENLAASRQLHGVREVVFVNHRDCGAMNLFAGRRLTDDPAAELRQHQEVMQRAAAEVRRRHPDMTVELRLLELDGSAQRLPCPACAPVGFRAEAVGPDTTPAPPQGFADLVALRLRDGAPGAEAERALLGEGVARFGLTAAAARGVLEAQLRRQGTTATAGKSRDAAALLRAQADRRGRVGEDDVARAAALLRGLNGGAMPPAEALRRAVALAEEEGLAPRPQGVLRSTRWYRRIAAA